MEEDSIEDHARELFDNPPRHTNTIPITLDEKTLKLTIGIPPEEILTNIIYRILMAGKKYIFKKNKGPIIPEDEWKNKLNIIQMYMDSIGVKMGLLEKRGLLCTTFTPIVPAYFPINMDKYVFPLCKKTN